MYPVNDGEEGKPPKGVIKIAVDTLDHERFFFNERFFCRVTAAPG